MPTPKEGETQSQFVSRCVEELHKEKGRWKNNDQIVAVCHSIWEQHEEKTEKKDNDD